MQDPNLTSRPLGVYSINGGRTQRVHAYQDGDYGLDDIAEVFDIGAQTVLDQHGVVFVSVSRAQLHKLKILADAYSFDHEPEFIEMCLALYRYGEHESQDPLQFFANF